MEVKLANPRGFCAGVDLGGGRIIRKLDVFGAPVYVRHEVVHNRFVVDDLTEKGAIFVDEIEEVPDNSLVIFSAHGVSKAVQEEAKKRELNVFDATCPLVTKVHLEVSKYSLDGMECILIGHEGHPEVEGTMGQYNFKHGGNIYLVENEQQVSDLQVQNEKKLAYVTQTTLSVDDAAKVIDALKVRFPSIQGPRKDDICYATQNRQDAVKALSGMSDIMLVVGSPNSSNSNRLRELAERMGTRAYLIDDKSEIEENWLDNVASVSVTAGASAPEVLVQDVVERLKELGASDVHEVDGRPENIVFSMPKALRIPAKNIISE